VSLEVRPPILDHTLVEWGMALPTALKLKGGEGKHILRQAVAPLLPERVLHGPKQGFAASIGAQLRAQAPLVKQRLLGGAMLDSGLFDAGGLAAMVDRHASGRHDHAQAIWQLLVLEGFLANEAGSTPQHVRESRTVDA